MRCLLNFFRLSFERSFRSSCLNDEHEDATRHNNVKEGILAGMWKVAFVSGGGLFPPPPREHRVITQDELMGSPALMVFEGRFL